VNSHYGPAKPAGSVLQRLELVLNRLPAISSADPDMQGARLVDVNIPNRLARIGNPSITKNLGLGLLGRGHRELITATNSSTNCGSTVSFRSSSE
jgi:hypothetical protein